MPCTAKKFEAGRPEMGRGGMADVDVVLTTRELASLIRMAGLNLRDLPPDTADTPLGERTTAGKLFGASGGVMEAAVRSAHYLVTGRELGRLEVEAVRGFDGVKEAQIQLGDVTLGVAVASGLGNAGRLFDQIRAGRNDLHFIEVMTCPGGCIGGGGQPIGADADAVRARMQRSTPSTPANRYEFRTRTPRSSDCMRNSWGPPWRKPATGSCTPTMPSVGW